jgi:hypothetical protein
MSEPLVKLDPAGKPPILSYNVPDSTSYSGRNGIVLELPEDVFLRRAGVPDERGARLPIEEVRELPAERILELLRVGDERVFPNAARPSATAAGLFSAQEAVFGGTLDIATASLVGQGLFSREARPDLAPLVNPAAGDDSGPVIERGPRDGEAAPRAAAVAATSLPPAVRGTAFTAHALAEWGSRPKITDLDPRHVVEQLKTGKRLNVYRRLSGDYTYRFQEEPTRIRPQLVLVETYRLSSFLGSYGAGRTLKTFSLLPGEKTTISVKTFRKTESESKNASSVLDSFTKESADDFENSLMQENSDKRATQESFEYHAEAEASASWGWGSAKVSGGVKGGTASQREEFTKNVSNALQKHSSKASSKRDVQVNTSTEVRESSGEETSIVREIENINVGRTLNFVFRQMNQEHVSLLHLVDVKVAFWNGLAESVREVPLSGLDDLLESVVVPERIDEVRDTVLAQLQTIFDHQDQLVDPPLVEERKLGDGDSYLRFRKELTSTYTDETGNEFTVPGAIVAVTKNVMRTEGIIVDAILGQGEALDGYSRGLQESSVRQRRLDNDWQQARLVREALARDIVAQENEKASRIYQAVFPAAVQLPGTISVSAGDGVDVAVPGDLQQLVAQPDGRG